VTLGGISVRIQQGTNTFPVPLFSLNQTNTCAAATTNECFVTGITVQIPFELVGPDQSAAIIISVNGVDNESMPLLLILQNPHILTSCDSIFVPALADRATCGPLVTHADGSTASYNIPVNGYHNGYVNRVIVSSGETIVIYATGLGPATSAVTTGAATPSPAPQVLIGLDNVNFTVGPNIGAVFLPQGSCVNHGYCPPPAPGQPSIGAWLVPGNVGLYQINITLPTYSAAQLLPGTCALSPITGEVSNVTLTLFGDSGITSIGLCMQAPAN
jgi:uncharacterized protein (TIGR03437 family)